MISIDGYRDGMRKNYSPPRSRASEPVVLFVTFWSYELMSWRKAETLVNKVEVRRAKLQAGFLMQTSQNQTLRDEEQVIAPDDLYQKAQWTVFQWTSVNPGHG
ncbi:Period circadian protein [Trichinella spiralis]|uniref:Period circadian protein n=1 Tax=Trichinella spiralis TaxID=6334 RepID=A0ABR3KLW3_TRISP